MCGRSYHPYMQLILASASPRRADLLRAAGFTFATAAADLDESIRPGESPDAYVRRLSVEKVEAVLSRLPPGDAAGGTGAVVIGADTAVVVDDEVLGKPEDDADAARMLRRLSGRSHRVLTGVCVRGGSGGAELVEETLVFFRHLGEDEVAWYVASGEGRDKAGGYAIQGLASRFVPRVEGSYSNVVGLPVARVAELLSRFR
jgi:septum formation protein